MSPECRRQLEDATTAVRRELDAVAPSAREWCFFEYCCGDHSILSAWCLRHGIEAVRLGLPNHNMSRQIE
eukprot:9994663-Heterocapsa_arctica.AAC.1